LVVNEYLKLNGILKVVLKKYKACLLIKYFTQKEGIDNKEIFSSVSSKILFKDNFDISSAF
jgi:hypothetical protein